MLEGLTSRSTPIKDPVVVMWEGSPRLLLIKATGRSHDEWWAVWLARRSLSLTFKDVNISFNHSPYYSMGRGKSRYNVMVTRPTNNKISTRDHSHDLLTWSRHVTTHMIYSHYLDMWPTNFILISRHYWYQHPHHHFITIS